MPLYIKIDFRADGLLSAWYSRDEPHTGEWARKEQPLTSNIKERDVCDVLRSLANELNKNHKGTE